MAIDAKSPYSSIAVREMLHLHSASRPMCNGHAQHREPLVIVAVAVNEDGKREVDQFWTDFLRSLADRGLRGVIVQSVEGLRAAARRVFNAACRVHWMRSKLFRRICRYASCETALQDTFVPPSHDESPIPKR